MKSITGDTEKISHDIMFKFKRVVNPEEQSSEEPRKDGGIPDLFCFGWPLKFCPAKLRCGARGPPSPAFSIGLQRLNTFETVIDIGLFS